VAKVVEMSGSEATSGVGSMLFAHYTMCVTVAAGGTMEIEREADRAEG